MSCDFLFKRLTKATEMQLMIYQIQILYVTWRSFKDYASSSLQMRPSWAAKANALLESACLRVEEM